MALFTLAACTVDPFPLNPAPRRGDGGATDSDGGDGTGSGGSRRDGSPDGFGDGALPFAEGGVSGDGGPCTPAVELCNGKDDDCDGQADEGFDLDTDPAHCGVCGNACSRPQTRGTCEEGQCAFECLVGHLDLDGRGGNGCEYACVESAGGKERCDVADNDCDGEVDEDFVFATDEKNCGGCGQSCPDVNGEPVCKKGDCTYPNCDPGFADILPDVPGCEYRCPDASPGAETCDTIDNDCDGTIDEDVPGTGLDCTDPGFETEGDTGACTFGRTRCVAAQVQCIGYEGPTTEVCDDVDTDCDGTVDDGFDKLDDVRYCESCAGCDLSHAVAGCNAGLCEITACAPGFVDEDGDVHTGCEYECTETGPEVCDGLDNDCDRLTDAADPDLALPMTNFCLTQGACAGTLPTCAADACDSKVRWRCVYPAQVETDACKPLLQETLCDDIDGDCDGRSDETFPLKDTPCDDGGVGVCQGTGELVCNGTADGLVCDITSPPGSASAETCNGKDDDCDTSLDEEATDDLVHVVVGLMDFWMYRYEASRPDASAASGGRLEHRACSNQGVLPWNRISQPEAEQACMDAGMRLCSEAEWQTACEGAAGLAYPYGNLYDASACNGADFDEDCAAPNSDERMPTGQTLGCPAAPATACVSPPGVVDLSGNLHEWTSEQVSAMPIAFRVRGGGYQTIALGLTCQHDFIAFEEDRRFDTLGFRCCSDMQPVPP
jgi:hypothetical protein